MRLSRNANSYRRRNVLIPHGVALISAGVLVLAFLLFILHTFAPGILLPLAAPVWNAGSGVAKVVSDTSSFFADRARVVQERDLLSAQALALNEENRTLRARLSDIGALGEGSTGMLAGVIARPPVSPYDTLIALLTEAGTVTTGAYAYGPGGVPLGTVDQVAGKTVRIALFSTGGRETIGWVGEKRIPITLVGRGGGAFEASLPRESGALVGDVVYVPGPGALPIGSIARIESDPSSPRDIVRIAPYANLFALTWVAIGTP